MPSFAPRGGHNINAEAVAEGLMFGLTDSLLALETPNAKTLANLLESQEGLYDEAKEVAAAYARTKAGDLEPGQGSSASRRKAYEEAKENFATRLSEEASCQSEEAQTLARLLGRTLQKEFQEKY